MPQTEQEPKRRGSKRSSPWTLKKILPRWLRNKVEDKQANDSECVTCGKASPPASPRHVYSNEKPTVVIEAKKPVFRVYNTGFVGPMTMMPVAVILSQYLHGNAQLRIMHTSSPKRSLCSQLFEKYTHRPLLLPGGSNTESSTKSDFTTIRRLMEKEKGEERHQANKSSSQSQSAVFESEVCQSSTGGESEGSNDSEKFELLKSKLKVVSQQHDTPKSVAHAHRRALRTCSPKYKLPLPSVLQAPVAVLNDEVHEKGNQKEDSVRKPSEVVKGVLTSAGKKEKHSESSRGHGNNDSDGEEWEDCLEHELCETPTKREKSNESPEEDLGESLSRSKGFEDRFVHSNFGSERLVCNNMSYATAGSTVRSVALSVSPSLPESSHQSFVAEDKAQRMSVSPSLPETSHQIFGAEIRVQCVEGQVKAPDDAAKVSVGQRERALSSSLTISVPLAETSLGAHPRSTEEESEGAEELLWIFHDNPRLATSLDEIQAQYKAEGKAEMHPEVLLETNLEVPGQKPDVVFVRGFVVENRLARTSPGKIPPRGGMLLKLANVRWFRVADLQTQQRENAIMLRLDDESAKTFFCIGNSAKGEKSYSQAFFFELCPGNIKVIFCPQRSGEWYPYKDSTTKKPIPAQFRSNGVGLLRLGDDMGINGRAFLSSDGGKTYLDDESCFQSSSSASSGDKPSLPRRGSVIDSPGAIDSPKTVFSMGKVSRDDKGRLELMEEAEKYQVMANLVSEEWQKQLESLQVLSCMAKEELTYLKAKKLKSKSKNTFMGVANADFTRLEDALAASIASKQARVLREALVAASSLSKLMKTQLNGRIIVSALFSKVKDNSNFLFQQIEECLEELVLSSSVSLPGMMELTRAQLKSKHMAARAMALRWCCSCWKAVESLESSQNGGGGMKTTTTATGGNAENDGTEEAQTSASMNSGRGGGVTAFEENITKPLVRLFAEQFSAVNSDVRRAAGSGILAISRKYFSSAEELKACSPSARTHRVANNFAAEHELETDYEENEEEGEKQKYNAWGRGSDYDNNATSSERGISPSIILLAFYRETAEKNPSRFQKLVSGFAHGELGAPLKVSTGSPRVRQIQGQMKRRVSLRDRIGKHAKAGTVAAE